MSNRQPALSIIIVTWNSEREIVQCIDSVITAVRSFRHEIIVVDNNSRDHTTAIIRKRFPHVRLYAHTVNYGFGQGNNIGLSKARYDTVLLLNPDTVVGEYATVKLWTFLHTHPDTGVVGPEQINEIGRSIFTTSKLSFRGIMHHLTERTYFFITQKHMMLFQKDYPVAMVNAGCLMARIDVLPTRTWFNPRLFIYGEEFDLFKKIRKRGWMTYFLRSCSIIHYRERSIQQTKQKPLFAIRSFSHLFLGL